MSDAKRAKVDASANSAGSSNGVPAEVSKALDALQVQLEVNRKDSFCCFVLFVSRSRVFRW
jgi:hypothetical protein